MVSLISVSVDAKGAAGIRGTASDAPERETQRVQRETEAAGGRADEGSTGREETSSPC